MVEQIQDQICLTIINDLKANNQLIPNKHNENFPLIFLDTHEGYNLLKSSNYIISDKIGKFFKKQLRNYSCGIASISYLIKEIYNSEKFSEDWFHEQEINLPQNVVKDGLDMDQITTMLIYILTLLPDKQIVVKSYSADQFTEETFKEKLIESIKNKLPPIPNYDEKYIYSNKKWGHFSPIVAYNEKFDKFLLLDVGVDTGFIWIGAKELLAACLTKDSESDKWRGLILAEKK